MEFISRVWSTNWESFVWFDTENYVVLCGQCPQNVPCLEREEVKEKKLSSADSDESKTSAYFLLFFSLHCGDWTQPPWPPDSRRRYCAKPSWGTGAIRDSTDFTPPESLNPFGNCQSKREKKREKEKEKEKVLHWRDGKKGAFLDKSSDWNTLTASSVKAICQCAFEKEIQLNAIEHSSKAPVMWHQHTVNEKALVSPLASHTNQLLTSIHCISKQAFPFCKNAYFPVSLISALNEEVKMGLDRAPTVD